MQNTQRHLRLIWADKIVLVLAILTAATAAFGWVMVAIAAGFMGANHVVASIGSDGALDLAAILLAIWATFRAVDFVAHGATYKLFHAAPAPNAPVLPTSGNLLAH